MKFTIAGGLRFWVYARTDGRWQYVFDDGEGVFSVESPLFPKRVKPSVKHFAKWIASTIQEEEGE
jgi:hypothetical protein